MPRILSSRILTSSLRTLALLRLEHAREVRDELSRQLDLGRPAERVLAAVVEKRDRILFRPERLLRQVRGEQRQLLHRALLSGVLRELLALGGETDAERRLGHPSDPGEDVGVLLELERQALAAAFLVFSRSPVPDAIVGDRRDRYEHVAAARPRLHGVEHLLLAPHLHPPPP